MKPFAALGVAIVVAGNVALMVGQAHAQWEVGEVRSHVEGTLGKGMWTKAIGARWRSYDIDLTLSVKCVKNSTTVLIYSERSLIASSDDTVAWSLDGGPVQRGRWDRTSDFSGVGLWHGNGIPFAKSLVGRTELKLSIIPDNGARTDATFLVSNAEAGLKEVGRQCGWQPPEAKQVARSAAPPKAPDTWATVPEGSRLSPTKDGYVWRNGARVGWVDQKTLTYYRLDQLEIQGDAPRPIKGAAGERFSVGGLEAVVEKGVRETGQKVDGSSAQKSGSIQKVERTADGFVWSSGRRVGWVDDKSSTYYRMDQITLRGEDRPTPRAGMLGLKVVDGDLNDAVHKADTETR
jgi:hypothetical protein